MYNIVDKAPGYIILPRLRRLPAIWQIKLASLPPDGRYLSCRQPSSRIPGATFCLWLFFAHFFSSSSLRLPHHSSAGDAFTGSAPAGPVTDTDFSLGIFSAVFYRSFCKVFPSPPYPITLSRSCTRAYLSDRTATPPQRKRGRHQLAWYVLGRSPSPAPRGAPHNIRDCRATWYTLLRAFYIATFLKSSFSGTSSK